MLTKYKEYPYTAECPHLATQHTIKIKYAELQMRGSLTQGYQKTGYSCEHAEGCSFMDDYNRCPVFLNAPDKPGLI